MSIDTATGLPELPEDHFWRVGKDDIQIMRSVPEGEWGNWNSYDHWYPTFGFYNEVEKRSTSKTVSATTGRWIFKKTVEKSVKVNESRVRTRAHVVVVATAEFGERAVKRVPDGEERVSVYGTYPHYGYSSQYKKKYRDKVVVVKPDPVTSDNVIERTLALLDQWKITGDYPPKKFGGES